MKGKHLSLLSKISALLWTAFWLFVFNWQALVNGKTLSGQSWEIIQQGIWFALLFAPVDISMIIQNMRGDRK